MESRCSKDDAITYGSSCEKQYCVFDSKVSVLPIPCWAEVQQTQNQNYSTN